MTKPAKSPLVRAKNLIKQAAFVKVDECIGILDVGAMRVLRRGLCTVREFTARDVSKGMWITDTKILVEGHDIEFFFQ